LNNINENFDLAFYLTRFDLWEVKFSELENLEDIITSMLYEFKLKIGQAYAFYNLIGEEDRNSLIELRKGNKNEKKEERKQENQIRLLIDQKIDNKSLIGKYDKEEDINNSMKNLRNDNFEVLTNNEIKNFKKNRNQNEMDNNAILNQDIKDQELNEINSRLILELQKEKEINNELSLKIKSLEQTIKEKEKLIVEEKREKNDLIEKMNNINNISNNDKIIELMEKLEKKEYEIKELKKIFPFGCAKEEKIFIVTFVTLNEDIHYSMICKNTDKFYRLEIEFYEKFPEFKKCNNNFLINGTIIDKFNNLESNNIKDNDIIIVAPIKNEK